jgi:hypothetical protein
MNGEQQEEEGKKEIELSKLQFEKKEMLKLESADGFEFFIDKRVAVQSKTIRVSNEVSLNI